MASKLEDELAPYVVKTPRGLQLGEPKGAGCYGAVYRVKVNGFPCIAKRLHDILVGQVSMRARAAITGRFREECVLLSKLRHPNIVQFIGVHYGRTRDDLTLLMEGLYTDLDKCLETCVEEKRKLPLPLQLSILLDVSYGLLYLHSLEPPIIHRDLKAQNILLTTDMRAKLADLGVSKILNLHPMSEMAQTICPGSPGIMPPEALVEEPSYDEKLDVFSFGTLVLNVVNHKFATPFEVLFNQCQEGGVQIAKRKTAIDQLGKGHCLYRLVISCLQDDPHKRPTTTEVCAAVERLSTPPRFKDVLEMYKEIEEVQTENQELKGELEAQRAQNAQFQQLQTQIVNLQAEVQAKEAECRQALSEREREHQNQLDQLLRETQEQLQFKNKELRNLQTKVEAKNTDIQQLTQRMQNMESRMQLPPTKRESVDERSIPQQRKRAPLPDWFKKLNDRYAVLVGITFSDVEADALSENLRSNTTVEILHFSNVKFSTNGLSTVLASLRENKSVKDLRFYNMTFSGTDSEVLAQVLRINTTIETLELLDVNIPDVGFTTLAEAMRDNQSLTTLKLYSVNISDVGFTTLAEAMRDNQSLTTLRLWNVNISDVGFTTLAEAMRDNQSLTTLSLGGTKISDGGVNALASAIHENNTLQTLVVRFNSVSDGGARDFAKKMEEWGSTLKTLVIYSTWNISEEVKKLLRETASRKGINLTFWS